MVFLARSSSFGWAGLFTALCLGFSACSREENLPEANRRLNQFLADPQPGESFERFLTDWDGFAERKTLESALVQRRAVAEMPENEAGVLLTQALANLNNDEEAWARESFNLLATHPGFSGFLTKMIERGGPETVTHLVNAVEASYLERRDLEEDEEPFDFGSEGWRVLEAIGRAPRCLWALQATLRDREWGGEEKANSLLFQMARYSRTGQPAQMADFIAYSPMAGTVEEFDPVEVEDRDRRTLMELIIYYFHRAGRPAPQLAGYLNNGPRREFGAKLMASQLQDKTDPAGAAARLYQGHLVAIKRLPPEQQDRLAEVASRLTGSLAGPDLKADGELAPFHAWLRDRGQSNPGTDLARTWLAATTWDELPMADEEEVGKRLVEMLHTLTVRDPAVARDLIIHLSRLDRERTDPGIYANRTTTIGDSALHRYLYENKKPISQALALNTLVHAGGEIGYAMGAAIDEWVRWDLTRTLYQPKQLPVRYEEFFIRISAFAESLEIEDPRVLIGPLRRFSHSLPINDVKIDPFLKELDGKIESAPDGSKVAAVYQQLRLAILMQKRALIAEGKAKSGAAPVPVPNDIVEKPYSDALADSDLEWTQRLAIGSSLLDPKHGPRSEVFVRAALDLLMEGYANGRRFTSTQEAHLVRAGHQVIMDSGDDELARRYLAAWKARYLQGIESNHQNEMLLRTVQMALNQDDETMARRILDGWEQAGKKPSAFIAMINGGALELARETLETHHRIFAFPATQVNRGPDFAANREAFLKMMAERPSGESGSDLPDPGALSLQARAMMHVAPGGDPESDESRAEAREISLQIAEAYRESDAPPAPVYHALLLMASEEKPSQVLYEPLQRWFDQLDFAAFFREGNYHSTPIITAIQKITRWHLSKAKNRDTIAVRKAIEAAASVERPRLFQSGRKTFYEEIFKQSKSSLYASMALDEELSAEKLDEWIALFRAFCEVPSTQWEAKSRGDELIALNVASALAGRCAELSPWWGKLAPDHRNFLGTAVSSGLWNGWAVTGSLVKNSPALTRDEEMRKQFAIQLLSAPQPRNNFDFTAPWVRRGMGPATLLLKWAPELVEGAERRGYTAFFLARMTRQKLNQPEDALRLIEQALGTERINEDDRNRFRTERARILADMGKTEDALELLEDVAAGPKLTPFVTGEVRNAIKAIEAQAAESTKPEGEEK